MNKHYEDYKKSLNGLRTPDVFHAATALAAGASWKMRRVFVVDPAANAISSSLKNFWGVDISSQIVLIEGCLEASVPHLIKSLSERHI